MSYGRRPAWTVQVVRENMDTHKHEWIRWIRAHKIQLHRKRKHGRRPGHETGRGQTSSKIENNFLILQIKNELIIQKAKHKLFQKSGLHRTRTLLPDEVIMEFVLNRTLELIQASLAQTWIYGIFKKHGCSIRLIRCSQTCNRLFMIFWIYFVKWISLFRFITPSF